MVNSKKRIVWICDPYSELPTFSYRPGRYHLIALYLKNEGFEVHVFISNFSHTFKNFLEFPSSDQVFGGIRYHIIESNSYRTHVSTERIRYERNFAKNMIKRVRKFDQKADLIILRDPLIFQIPFLIRYLKETKIPYLVDIIDLWPELFVSKLPTFLKRFQGLIFFSLYKRRERFLDGAQLITTVTTDYMRILSVKAMRTPRIVTYWGVDCANANLLLKAEKSTLKLAKAEGEFWITYTGTLGVNYDIGIILDTAKMFKNIDYIKFIIAGKGPLESQVRSFILSNELTNLVYIGFISQHELFPLLSKSDLGLLTYSKNSTVAMPIKAYDYLATGLPILNCLKGEIGDLITTYELGFNYSAEDVNSFIDSINVAFEMRITLEKSRERIKSFSHKFDARIQYATLAKFIGDNI